MRDLSQMEQKKLDNIVKSYAFACKYSSSKRCRELAYEARELGMSLEELNEKARQIKC